MQSQLLIDQAEERTSEPEDCLSEVMQADMNREKRVKRNKQTFQEIWDYVKRPDLQLIGVPERAERNGTNLENIFQDITHENFPNLARQANIQIQEMQTTPVRYSTRRSTPRCLIIRISKIKMKEKNIKAAREKGQVIYKGESVLLTVDLSVETLQARGDWGPILNILKKRNSNP
uniref:L1 transposable element RRM domain-containing protein n=1 Tax=Macaca fascicularis TaxID=9541 RepID=A0A7N9IEN6_MACFA